MAMLVSTTKKLAQLGANIEITSDANYLASSVEELVKIVKENNAHITIHAGKYLASSLEKFVRIGGANVTIVI